MTPTAATALPPPATAAPATERSASADALAPASSFRSLAALIFQGDFVGNAFRLLLMIWASAIAEGAVLGEQIDPDNFRTVVAAVFTAPWILFSLMAGQLADRFSKRRVVLVAKAAEVLIFLLGGWALARGDWHFSLIVLALLATQAALHGPAKYGMIPELLPKGRLAWGNGWADGLSFLAMLAGTALGGELYDNFDDRLWLAMMVLAGISLVGFVVSLTLRGQPAAQPQRPISFFPWGQFRANLSEIWSHTVLRICAIGLIVWWGGAALALQLTYKLADDTLHLEPDQISLFILSIAFGIGIGSWAAGRLSKGHIELGLVPLGGLGMALFSGLVFFVPRPEELEGPLPALLSAASLMLMGFFSGWFVVPLKAYIQHRVRRESLGGVLGAVNFLQYLAIVACAAGLYFVMASILSLNAPKMFLILGIAFLAVTVTALIAVPQGVVRAFIFLASKAVYRLRLQGLENIPREGGALLVCNHVTYVDWLLIMGSLERPVRPVIYDEIYRIWWVKPFVKAINAIPISARMGPREVIEALKTASDTIKNGDLVLLFPEGSLTRVGRMLPFRRGIERIMKDVPDAPIIPMHLDRLWGSIFSFAGGRYFTKFPRAVPYAVTLSVGVPLPGATPAWKVRQEVQRLESDAWQIRKGDARPLHREAFRTVRSHPFHRFVADANNLDPLPMWKAATAIVALGHVLRGPWKDQDNVGICLPPSLAGAAVNIAALLMGKVPINLNYTAASSLPEICDLCRIRTIITSRAFLEKFPLELPGEVLYAEDLKAQVTGGLRLRSMLSALLMPMRLLERSLGATRRATMDDTATVIFSSGSTGTPKGVVLSHWNIMSNVDAFAQVYQFTRQDGILGALPLFHSFGFTVGLALPFTTGLRVTYYPNPLDARAIGALVHQHGLTILIATPTFLQGYTRRIEPEQFGSLRLVVTGAEKLRAPVARAFEDKFGIRVLEGYGATETSPVTSVNAPDYRSRGIFQRGTLAGTVGLTIPGVSVRVTDLDGQTELEPDQEGMLWVRGPNIMQGYLKRPDLTHEVLLDGWYRMGDIAKIDEDGFITITDRLSRFSKIGGEMVPHLKLEDALQEILAQTDRVVAVTGLPDESKGEKLAVLFTVPDDDMDRALESLKGRLPNLWMPKRAECFCVAELPLLGSGKLDLKEVKRVAAERASNGQ